MLEMPFADFVRDMYECIKEYSHCETFSLSVFAEGPDALKPDYTAIQEYAVLRNRYAETFFNVMESNSMLYAPNQNICLLEASRIMPGTVKVTHSCYPKNLRRWMKGTLSRKQKCRAELCVLIWCWFEYWMVEIVPDIDKEAFSQSLFKICHKYTDYGDSFCIEVLWHGCTLAYWKALGRI